MVAETYVNLDARTSFMTTAWAVMPFTCATAIVKVILFAARVKVLVTLMSVETGVYVAVYVCPSRAVTS